MNSRSPGAGGAVDPWDEPDPALAVALRELGWYRRNADRNRVANRATEVALLLGSAATTVAAALGATAWVTAVLAAATLVVTGLRRSFDWHENWVEFIGRWSELRSVVHQYRLLPEERRGEADRRALLAAVDEIVASETQRWASRRRKLQESTGQGPSA
ncbi:hypothetical protein H4696_002500 [Amycolatopsis lexingtonensis]|uniref:DUF4231 domain-containing protein n=1 Tax=Amycolatopsis lexingtonensis TaxID=218822 RepID=A0ABR9HWU4_9PSEU|nr:DUF4231 domain-containing protein [Amycolatopsis lexingtonensis]MBE1495400.1 hypothetical protein [Amycolatopsis lexingtonensis]